MIGSVTTLSILLLASVELNCILLYLMLNYKETGKTRMLQTFNVDAVEEEVSACPDSTMSGGAHTEEQESMTISENQLAPEDTNNPVSMEQSQETPENDICPKDDQTDSQTDGTTRKQVAPESLPKENEKKDLSRVRNYTVLHAGPFMIQGLSIQGQGHLIDNKPCQDYHCVDTAGEDFVIAVVSDGAGSKKNSAYGSSLVCEKTVQYLKEAIKSLNWGKDSLPDSKTWNAVFRKIVQLVQGELGQYAKAEGHAFDSLAATLIVLLVGPGKTYAAHVGDGRAGVLTPDGWKAVMTPHQGPESNQTVFMTNRILDPGLKISGVSVPETMVIEEPISAFALMSDGLENGFWIKNKKEILPDGDFRYKKMNVPFEPALNDVVERMSKCEEGKEQEVFFSILDHYNVPLKCETDDKTLCLAYIPATATDKND
jgi:serine/threonine protein phosphatase PrpC